MAESFVVVHRSYDSLQAEQLGDLLRDYGIPARVIGPRSAAMVGIGQNAIQVRIEVPADQAGAATDFLEAFFAQQGEELLRAEGVLGDDDGDDTDDDDEPNTDVDDEPHGAKARDRELGRRSSATPTADGASVALSTVVEGAEGSSPLLAAGLALLTFGVSHIFVGRRFTGLVMAVAEIAAIYMMARADSWPVFMTTAVFIAALVIADFAGAQLVLRSPRAVPRGAGFQIGTGLLYAVASLAAAAALGPRIPMP